MKKNKLQSLGAIVRKKRSDKKLRETAVEIGISPATLMRIENGYSPDVATFGKICHWLEINPGDFLGFEKGEREEADSTTSPLIVSAHFRANRNPTPETAQALAKMLLMAAKMQPGTES